MGEVLNTCNELGKDHSSSTGKLAESRQTDSSSDRASLPPEICIRNSSDLEEKTYQIGDRVEAKYRGRGRRYYKGVIAGVQPGGLYNVDYDDGDKDFGLSVEFIRRLPSKDDETTEKQEELVENVSASLNDADNKIGIKVGQKVEAKYRNRGRRWYKGTIVGVLPNGFYNVKYDDGDRDKNLPASAIRTVEDSNGPKLLGDDTKSPTRPASPDEEITEQETNGKKTSEASESCSYHVGQMVEARYKGRGRRWYKGSVIECFSNGTYDIQYADGDKDFGLAAMFIRAIDAPPNDKVSLTGLTPSRVAESSKAETTELSSQKESTYDSSAHNAGDGEGSKRNESGFNEGDRVEAKFRGRGSRWYKGIIASCLPNRTYTVQYDDGDKDAGLPSSAIRAVNRGPGTQKLESLADMDEIKLTRSTTPSGCANDISAVDGDVSFVAQDLVSEKPNSAVKNTVEEELSQVEDVVSEDIQSSADDNEKTRGSDSRRNIDNLAQQHDPNNAYSGKGNRLYRGVVSKVKVVYLYEIEYEDGTKDVNIPFGALHTQDGVRDSDVRVGTSVDVLSWQDRFWGSNQ